MELNISCPKCDASLSKERILFDLKSGCIHLRGFCQHCDTNFHRHYRLEEDPKFGDIHKN